MFLSAFPCTIVPHHQLNIITEFVLDIEKWSTQGINEVTRPRWVVRARHHVGPWSHKASSCTVISFISQPNLINRSLSWRISITSSSIKISNASFGPATGTLFHCSAMGRKAARLKNQLPGLSKNINGPLKNQTSSSSQTRESLERYGHGDR